MEIPVCYPAIPTVRRLSTQLLLITALLCLAALWAPPLHAQAPVVAAPPASDGSVAILVEMVTPSAGEVYLRELARVGAADANSVATADVAQLVAVTQAQLATIATEQSALLATLEGLGAQPLYTAQRVYNGVAVRIAADRLAEVGALPGVKAVHRIVLKQPDNATSVPFLGVPQAWTNEFLASRLGDGITIGIIDTGIDYLHTAFGGPGTGYSSNDTQNGSDLEAFPGPKVVGGHDFAGDFYTGSLSGASPLTDDDPMDCYGHGSHVAGTAAGYGVLADGSTFHGVYDRKLDFSKFEIGPGVAPLAQLYALKVFGCFGGSEVVDAAVEWSVDPNQDGDFSDHLDVINLSLGSALGSGRDTLGMAVDQAGRLGVIVVASAGNAGDIHYISGSPAAADYAISVAATTASIQGNNAAALQADQLAYFTSRGPRRGDSALKPDIAAPGVDTRSVMAGTGTESWIASGTSMAAPHISGIMALLRESYPSASATWLKAVLMNSAAPVIRTGPQITGTLSSPAISGAGRVNIQQALRARGAAYAMDNPALVSLNFGVPDVVGTTSLQKNVLVEGVGAYQAIYVPVTDMPGVDLTVANGGIFTVPAAGPAVLPVTLTAVAANMRNIRDPNSIADFEGLRAWQTEESGHLWLWPRRADFWAVLRSPYAAQFDPVVDPLDSPGRNGAHFSLDPASRTLDVTFTFGDVVLSGVRSIVLRRGSARATYPEDAYTLYTNATDGPLTNAFATSIVLSEQDMRWLGSSYLQLVLKTTAHPEGDWKGTLEGNVLKLPVYAAPRAASTFAPSQATLDFGKVASGFAALSLRGSSLAASGTPTATQALMGAFVLQTASPRQSGNVFFPVAGSADIQYVGVSSDYPRSGTMEESMVYFAISTWEPRETPNEVSIQISVDSDEDGFADYQVVSSGMPDSWYFFSFGDMFVTLVEDRFTGSRQYGAPLNGFAPMEMDTAIYNTNVVVLAAPARLLGLSEQNTTFSYRVDIFPLTYDAAGFGDSIPTRSFDVRAQGVRLNPGYKKQPFFLPLANQPLTANFHLVNYAKSGALGLLLLFPHNPMGSRTAVVPVEFTWPYSQHFPVIQR